MKFETIAEIYEMNDGVRARLKELVSSLSEDSVNVVPEGENWSITNIVEHLAKVEQAMMGISAKLLAEAEGISSDGTANLSQNFLENIASIGEQKFDAPEFVQPEGSQSISELIIVLDETRKSLNGMREKFETVEGTKFTFPHPYFGDMTAQDWLALVGGHESRHIAQIERILSTQNDAQD